MPDYAGVQKGMQPVPAVMNASAMSDRTTLCNVVGNLQGELNVLHERISTAEKVLSPVLRELNPIAEATPTAAAAKVEERSPIGAELQQVIRGVRSATTRLETILHAADL